MHVLNFAILCYLQFANLLQRVDRETTKSPATTGSRKKSSVRSNGQIINTEPTAPLAGNFSCFMINV